MQPYAPSEKDYNRPLPPGQLALRKIGPQAYPDFGEGFANRARLEEAIRHSLEYLAKPSSRKYFPYGDVSHERAVQSLQEFLRVLQTARTPAELNEAVRRDFDVYQSVGYDGNGVVFFTGYYCPIFDGRAQRDDVFRYPLYKLPPDLVKDAEGTTLGRRTPDGRIVPYYTRREIEEQRLLEGTEIAWLKDPFEAYIVTVQGSARLRLADGTLWELGYAGNNGHEYSSVAQAMIADGVLTRKQLSLQNLIRYFKAHPEDLRKYVWRNDRYVFFKETSGGPYGSIGARVTPYRSIATDKEVYPRACLAFLRTSIPVRRGDEIDQARFSSFVLDQDTGGAIRAAGRCDIYVGIGPAAEAVAGGVGSEGALYYVFVKEGGGRVPGAQ
jgi:membrane-bound lytic murein transglycosylase A